MGRLFRLSSITGQSAAHDGSRICANRRTMHPLPRFISRAICRETVCKRPVLPDCFAAMTDGRKQIGDCPEGVSTCPRRALLRCLHNDFLLDIHDEGALCIGQTRRIEQED